MSAETTSLTKENIDRYLKELGKEYRRLTGGKMDAEVIIVGGGTIVLNHDFREATDDIDAMIEKGSILEEAAENVSDRLGISPGWFNTDFKNTASYSDMLREVSVHYKTVSNHVDIRTVPDEYVIAMKLVSNRDYKHDRSDIVGILRDNAENGRPLTKEQIESAVTRLYGSHDAVSDSAWKFLDKIMINGNYDELYTTTANRENENKKLLKKEAETNPNVFRKESIRDILDNLHNRKYYSNTGDESDGEDDTKSQEPNNEEESDYYPGS